MLLCWIIGCAVEPDCVNLRGEDAFANAIMPFDVEVDAEARVGWATSLGNGVLLKFDLDTGEQLASIRIAESALPLPEIALSAGELWLGTTNGLFRWDQENGGVVRVGPPDSIDDLAPHPNGIAALRRSGGERWLTVYSPGGEELASRSFSGVGALIPHPDGMMVFDDAGGSVLDEDLQTIGACAPPFSPVQHGVVLDDGRVVVSDAHTVGFCDGQSWTSGVQNAEVVAFGEVALVLDPIGPEEPNLGMAWRLDENGPTPAFQTAKNTQFGEIDPVRGLLWMNSEGTGEIVAMDPTSGEVVHRIEVGTFADGIALDPGDPDARWVSGRLSNSIFALRDTEIAASTEAVPWPVSPTIAGETLWVLNQLDGMVVGLDRSTLEVLRTWDLEVDANPLLTFGSLTADPQTGHLWVAESHADRLYELDPDEGVLRSWDLGGPRVSDPDQIGELAVRVHPKSGAVFVARSSDGRLQRLDPETGEIAGVVVEDLPADRTDVLRVFAREGWFGPIPFDLDTLEIAPERRLPLTRVVGPWPMGGGGWVGLSEDGLSLVHVKDDGRIKGTMAFAARDINALVLRMIEGSRAISVGRASQAFVCWVDAADLE